MAGRLDRLSVTEAAKKKGCTRQGIHYAIHTGKIDAEDIGAYKAVVANARFEDWQPNPKIQKAGKARWKGTRKARVKKAKKAKR